MQNHSSLRASTVLTALIAATLTIALSGCSMWPFGSDDKLKPLPAVNGNAAVVINWQSNLGGKQSTSLTPAVSDGRVYAAHPSGIVASYDQTSGASAQNTSLALDKNTISGGVATFGGITVVGTRKGDVIALDKEGKTLWKAKTTSEVVAPAAITDTMVIALSGDGSIAGFDIKTGERKWILPRGLPALSVRSTAIPVATRGGVFVGTAQGKLLAIDAATGSIGWESIVATPKGTSELERLVDVVGRPVFDDKQVCAVAFQGRVACFDIAKGSLLWSREISSISGLSMDAKNLYVTDEKGIAHALDKSTGGTIWKQDVLAGRRATGAALMGAVYAVHDHLGNLHLIDPMTGKIVGRGLGESFAAESGLIPAGDSVLLQTKSGVVLSISAR